MTPDDAHTSHNHGFELPDAPLLVVRKDVRPWRAVAGVAVCLGLVGIITGLIVAHRQSVNDEHLISDALQREELREGWQALGAVAAHDAQVNDVQASPAPTASAAPPNVVIVNVPAQGTAAAPSNVTNINLPNGSAPAANGAPTDSNASAGYAPIQSMPAITYSPVQGYLPTPTQLGYVAPLGSDTPQTNFSPQNSYGTTTGGAVPFAPAVGNGTIPGSTPNPALPNNGLVGTPAVPNGSAIGSLPQSAPVGGVPTLPGALPSPGTPSLPSGFSAP
ncbi:MAG: hypothetical protein WDO69_09120 [Pseudomonadota bacterium]